MVRGIDPPSYELKPWLDDRTSYFESSLEWTWFRPLGPVWAGMPWGGYEHCHHIGLLRGLLGLTGEINDSGNDPNGSPARVGLLTYLRLYYLLLPFYYLYSLRLYNFILRVGQYAPTHPYYYTLT